MLKAIRINPEDNVAVAPQNVQAGEKVQVVETGKIITVTEFIKAGHKIAMKPLPKGSIVIKYGIPIGRMLSDAAAGTWIHCHNVEDITEELCSGYCRKFREGGRKIMAYPRKDGTFGVRNYIMAIPTFLGGNAVAEAISDKTGCLWMVLDKEHLENGRVTEFTQKAMTYTGRNPNMYGVLVVGPEGDDGCSRKIMEGIKETGKPVEYLAVKSGVCDKALEKGVSYVEGLKKEAASLKREPTALDGFKLAIHCGGSDWTTALSGNPTLGRAADRIVAEGGMVLMDELGGLPGSEHLLAGHAVTRKVALQLLDVVDETRARFIRDTGKPVEAVNPYPDNKEGGITTLVEKSTGNIKKAGSAGLQGLLGYCETPTTPGVYVQNQPCGSPPSTGIYGALCGVHMNVFVTGVGYIYFEIPHMPNVRMTGNPETFKNKDYKLDFNAGVVMEGTPMDQAGEDLFDYLMDVAEGKIEPKSEEGKNRAFLMCYYNDEPSPSDVKLENYKEGCRRLVDRKKA